MYRYRRYRPHYYYSGPLNYEIPVKASYYLAIIAAIGNLFSLFIDAVWIEDTDALIKYVATAAISFIVLLVFLEAPKKIHSFFINKEKYSGYKAYSAIAYVIVFSLVFFVKQNQTFAIYVVVFGIVCVTQLHAHYVEIARTGYAGLDLE